LVGAPEEVYNTREGVIGRRCFHDNKLVASSKIGRAVFG
jgi:hypothetical protein